MKLYFESKKPYSIKEHYVDDEFLSGDKVRYFNDYYEAKKYAEDLGLKESEYGTMYGCSYCCWNKAGDRNYPEEVCAYYEFKNGRPIKLSLDMAKKVKKYTDVDFLNDEDYWDDTKPYFENKAGKSISKAQRTKEIIADKYGVLPSSVVWKGDDRFIVIKNGKEIEVYAKQEFKKVHESYPNRKLSLYVNGEYICSSTKYKTAKEFKDSILNNGFVKYAGINSIGSSAPKDIKKIGPDDKVIVKYESLSKIRRSDGR